MDELLTPDLIEDLKKIFKYFGGMNNKLEKLYQESGEFRDIWLLRGQDTRLLPEIREEIADIISVALQMYIHSPALQEEVRRVVKKAVKKIDSGYYSKGETHA
jgi:NTP pyrophosphatase (non-canonical NTP hydrolase)